MYADFHLNLQIWSWPLIHTSGKNSSWCYFLKGFPCTGSFSVLFVLFCCLAEVTWLLNSRWSEVQWSRSCLWAEGSWAGHGDHRPPWSGMNVLRPLSLLWTWGCCCTACWLLTPCLLQRWSSSLQEDGTLLGQTCGTRNHYKSNCIFGWRLPSLTLPFSQNTPHCCTCIFPQGRKGNGEERHLVDITLLVQFPNSERWYPADECSIKTE